MRRLGQQVPLFRAALRNTLQRREAMSEAAFRAQSGPQVWSSAQRWILSLDLSFLCVTLQLTYHPQYAVHATANCAMKRSVYRILKASARAESQKFAGIELAGWHEFTLPGSLMQLPRRGTRLARHDHLVGIDEDSQGSAVEIRRGLHVLDRCPTLGVVADIDLDAVAVGIFIVETGLSPLVDRKLRHDPQRLESRIASQ